MTLERLRQRMQIDGWCVLDNIIPVDRLDGIRDRVIVSTNRHRSPDAPANIGHVSGFLKYDQSLAPWLADRRIVDLAGALLGHLSLIHI